MSSCITPGILFHTDVLSVFFFFSVVRIIDHLGVHQTRQALKGVGPCISLCLRYFILLRMISLMRVFRTLWKAFPSCSEHMELRMMSMEKWWRQQFLQIAYCHCILELSTHMTELPCTKILMAQTLKYKLHILVKIISFYLLQRYVGKLLHER